MVSRLPQCFAEESNYGVRTLQTPNHSEIMHTDVGWCCQTHVLIHLIVQTLNTNVKQS